MIQWTEICETIKKCDEKLKYRMFFTGTYASSYLSEEEVDIFPETYGILGKLECKLCKEAMKIVEKEVNKNSAKVNFNLFVQT